MFSPLLIILNSCSIILAICIGVTSRVSIIKDPKDELKDLKNFE